MATEARVRQATRAARRLQTLHKGEASYLVLANSDGIDYMETDTTQQNIEYLARWSILGVIATSGADVVWMELLRDHEYPPFTEQEIATAMEWTRDHDPAHYTPEYCAAKILAFCASRRFDANGPILMGERLIFDPSVPSETDGLLLEIAGVLDTTSERSNSRLTRENFFSTMMARFSSSGRVSQLRTKSARLNIWSPRNRTRAVVSWRPWRTSCFTENWPAKS
jgi:hypothetical protein